MQRDTDLIRELLLEIESNQEGTTPYRGEGWGEVHYYHLILLADADYLVTDDPDDCRSSSGAIYSMYAHRITWQGHEFLDTIRDPGVYARTKSLIGEKVVSTSLTIFSEVAASVIRGMFNIP